MQAEDSPEQVVQDAPHNKVLLRRLSPAQRREIVVSAAAGERIAALARRFEVSRATIYRTMDAYAALVAKPPTRATGTRISIKLEPVELAALDALAARMNLSRSDVTRLVRRRAAALLDVDDHKLFQVPAEFRKHQDK